MLCTIRSRFTSSVIAGRVCMCRRAIYKKKLLFPITRNWSLSNLLHKVCRNQQKIPRMLVRFSNCSFVAIRKTFNNLAIVWMSKRGRERTHFWYKLVLHLKNKPYLRTIVQRIRSTFTIPNTLTLKFLCSGTLQPQSECVLFRLVRLKQNAFYLCFITKKKRIIENQNNELTVKRWIKFVKKKLKQNLTSVQLEAIGFPFISQRNVLACTLVL